MTMPEETGELDSWAKTIVFDLCERERRVEAARHLLKLAGEWLDRFPSGQLEFAFKMLVRQRIYYTLYGVWRSWRS
jgi:hypothetical protein